MFALRPPTISILLLSGLFQAIDFASTAATQRKSSVSTVAVKGPVVESVIDKYYDCQDKCKEDGLQMQCGENGWWFVNKCHRECEGVKISPMGEQMCNPFERMEIEQGWKCDEKCKGIPEKMECGEDGTWFKNSCNRECYEIRLVDRKLCERLDKEEECKDKCLNKGHTPDCGIDGKWYDNQCERECQGVKLGKEGHECKLRMHLGKFYTCQEKCDEKGRNDECGKAGFWYFNKCHLDCYGDKPGEPGKDCPPSTLFG